MREAQFERIESSDRQGWLMFRREETFGYEWHFHPEYELTLITHGSGTRFVGDSIDEFGVGDLVLIGPNLPHTYVSNVHSGSLCCQFGDNLLGLGWAEHPAFDGVAALLRRSRRGIRFAVPDLTDWWQMYASDPARRTHALLGHLIDLAERRDGRELASDHYEPQLDHRTMTRIELIMRYIDDNLAENFALDDVAKVACLSPSATSRFFRRQTGRTMTDYVNQARVAAACRMLTRGQEPVGQIAWACGFGNLANFHRQFRRVTGVTPTRFRSQSTRTSVGAIADLAADEVVRAIAGSAT